MLALPSPLMGFKWFGSIIVNRHPDCHLGVLSWFHLFFLSQSEQEVYFNNKLLDVKEKPYRMHSF